MTQKSTTTSIDGSYSIPPKKNYITNKTGVYHIDDIWKLDMLDLKDYCTENNRGYRYVLVVNDNFSKLGWPVFSKNKKDQTMKDSLKIILLTSRVKQKLIETVRGKELFNSICQTFPSNSILKHYSRNTSVGAVFAERFNRTIGDILKRPVFEKGESIWVDILPTKTKQYNSRVHISVKLTPIQAFFKKKSDMFMISY